MIKFIWIPKEVWYYVAFPIFGILIFYLLFNLFYSKKKGTYYYNYVVDYVYSTLGIVFCGLLFCLLLGYSIATLQILSTNNLMKVYTLLTFILIILPIIPAAFLVYVISVFYKNLKRKEVLDKNLEAEMNGETISKSDYDVSKQNIRKMEHPIHIFNKDKIVNQGLDNDYKSINNEEMSNNGDKIENELDNTKDNNLNDNLILHKEYEERKENIDLNDDIVKKDISQETNDISNTIESDYNYEKNTEFDYKKGFNLEESNIDISTNQFQEEDFVPIKKNETYEENDDYNTDNELEINDIDKTNVLNNKNKHKRYYYNNNYHNRNNKHNKYYNRNHKYYNNNSNQQQNNNNN